MYRVTSFILSLLLLSIGAVSAQAQTYADAPQRSALKGYGNAVAVTGGDVFVGEPQNTYRSGLVYRYQKQDDGTWAEVEKLQASDAVESDHFGSALAADGERLLVGASEQGTGGAAYLFEQSGESWREVARLVPEETAEGEQFGSSVALNGRWAAVGASAADSSAGAVYVFRQEGDAWRQVARLGGSAAGDEARFGAALALRGDRLLVGAPTQSGGQGAAYLFTREGNEWQETALLANGQEDRLGASLVLQHGKALVGAPRHGSSGTVLVFGQSDDGSWRSTGQLQPFDAPQRAFFGAAVVRSGNDTWVSAPGAAQGGGRLYAFEYGDGTWQGATVVQTDAPSRSFVGRSLAVDGDVAVAGASGMDHGAGAATIFEREAGSWTASSTVRGDVGGMAAVHGETVECTDGEAAGFDCEQMNLMSFTPIRDIGGGRGINLNDIWGWTDPETGTEYALVGRTDGTAFVDISDPQHPVYVGELPMTDSSNVTAWRDVKVYKNHAFVVADNAGEHGMQIFDLTRLRDVSPDEAPVTFDEDARYDQINSAHNVVVNPETGYAFIVGASGGGRTCGGGLHMVNIDDPLQPTFAGCFADESTGRKGTGYSHDAQCVVYHGPDGEHEGQEICFGANETALSIADVTDKENPKAVAVAEYPGVAYTHQGWITPDHRYFYLNDELDELSGKTEQTRTLIWDITDLDDPQLVKEYTFGPTSTDHNLYIKGNRMYQSNYKSGLRVHDISNPTEPVEVAYFDTSPAGDNEAGFAGTWSNYPYFESGVIAVSSIGEGLFLLKPKRVNL